MKLRTVAIVATAAGAAVVLRNKIGIVEDLDWNDAPRRGALIDIDGVRIHYIDEGSGPAVVLIHGFGGQTYQFRHVIPSLARDHRVIAVDLKSFGYSERSTHNVSHTDQVTMLHALLRKLGVARATFVGHSMGGAVVQRFAATFPEMVDALVLAASAVGDERFGRREPPAWLLRPIVPILGKVVAKRLFEASFFDPSKITAEMRDEYHRPERIRGSMDALVAMMTAGADDAPIDRSRITMPVLLLYAADDKVARLSLGQKLREQLPQAKLVVLDRCGHLLFDEQPQECERAIRDFLREAHVGAETASV